MDPEQAKKLSLELIVRDKWADSLKRFVDVLRINIFVVDARGRVVIPPVTDRDNRGLYGAHFINSAFDFSLTSPKSDILASFKPHGAAYLEACGRFDLYAFAVPVKVEGGTPIAHLLVGPVILNRRWDSRAYVRLAQEMKMETDQILDVIHEIRVVSFVTMKAVLDLLAQIAKDIIDLSLENKKLHQKRFKKEILAADLRDAVQDLYNDIQIDELLVTVLDVALKCTGVECGSIMLFDKAREKLSIKVAKGIENEKLGRIEMRTGEGIAGIAAQENRSFVISGMKGESRISHLLKRPEIQKAAVVPLSVQNRVFGVLNLHTKQKDARVEMDEGNLQHLSLLISTALHNIH